MHLAFTVHCASMRFFLLSGVLFASVASAQVIYKWNDAEGTTHFTDDLSTVPKGIKATKVDTTDQDGIELVREDAAAQVIELSPAEKELKKKEQEARKRERDADKELEREELWRKRFRDAQRRIVDLDEEIVELDRKLTNGTVPEFSCATGQGQFVNGRWVTINGTPYTVQPSVPLQVFGAPANTLGCLMQRNEEWLRLSSRLDQAKRDVVRAREDLQELNRQASFQSVPVEWRR